MIEGVATLVSLYAGLILTLMDRVISSRFGDPETQ